jgi:hypothetical protein
LRIRNSGAPLPEPRVDHPNLHEDGRRVDYVQAVGRIVVVAKLQDLLAGLTRTGVRRQILISGTRFLQVKRDPQENAQALYQIADAPYDSF